jgi:hypothetical protein
VFEDTAVSRYWSYLQSITPSKLRVQSAVFRASLSDRICFTVHRIASDKILRNNDYLVADTEGGAYAEGV